MSTLTHAALAVWLVAALPMVTAMLLPASATVSALSTGSEATKATLSIGSEAASIAADVSFHHRFLMHAAVSKGHQFKCAEELAVNSTCVCPGFVKFGHGAQWSAWENVSGVTDCQSGRFGDPAPGLAKECVCQPSVWYIASEHGELGYANCSDPSCSLASEGKCHGKVSYGYGDRWTVPKTIDGKVKCADKTFGDPFETQGKLCKCEPDLAYMNQLLADSEPASGSGKDGGSAYEPVGRLVCGAVAVTLCYFMVYVWLAIARLLTQMSSLYSSGIGVTALSSCTSSVYLAPMLCVVYFAVNKRADTLTGGNPSEYGYPPRWLGISAVICASAFCFQVLFHLLAEWIVAQQAYRNGEQRRRALTAGTTALVSQEQREAEAREVWRMTRGWRYLNGFAVGITYLFVVLMLIGLSLMTEPASLVQAQGAVPVAPGTVCTIGLAVVYFAVYLVLHCLKTRDLLRNLSYSPVGVVYSSFGAEVMGLAANAINFAPMLCAVFMASQISADWAGTGLSPAVEACTYVCTFAVLAQVVLVLLTPFMSDADLEVTSAQGEVNFVTRNRGAFIVISFVRWAAMTALYVGVVILCMQLWNTPAAPPLMHLVARFAAIYFVSYLVLWVAITGRVIMEGGLLKIIRIMSVVKDTVAFCPMLAILALISFVRARHLTNKLGQHGVPQGYVQDYMYVGLWALIIQLLMTLISGVVNRAPVGATMQLDEPQDKTRGDTLPVWVAIYSISTGVLFFSVLVEAMGLFTITSENAHGNDARFV